MLSRLYHDSHSNMPSSSCNHIVKHQLFLEYFVNLPFKISLNQSNRAHGKDSMPKPYYMMPVSLPQTRGFRAMTSPIFLYQCHRSHCFIFCWFYLFLFKEEWRVFIRLLPDTGYKLPVVFSNKAVGGNYSELCHLSHQKDYK